ncbi:MAG: hypothetical protein KDD58_02330 [Bdellovibrionales bacterium]|nr:hypothetical protein [Bdellovibrionales bacterium]
MKIILLTLCFLVSPIFQSEAKLYKYNELEIKSYDELSQLVKDLIQKAELVDVKNQKEAEAIDEMANYDTTESIDYLKEALRLIFSRPNKDNMVEKLIPEVRSELISYSAYYDSIYDLVVEAVAGLNQKIPVVYKSTYIFVLENVMSEFRPQLKTSDEVKKIFFYIRDSGASVPEDVRLDRKLRSMFKSQDPSDTAKAIIDKELPKTERKEKKGFWERLFGNSRLIFNYQII